MSLHDTIFDDFTQIDRDNITEGFCEERQAVYNGRVIGYLLAL